MKTETDGWKLVIGYIHGGNFTTNFNDYTTALARHKNLVMAVTKREDMVDFLDNETGRIDTILLNQIKTFWIEPLETK